MADFERLQAAVEAGDRDVAVEITQAAIDQGIPPLDILDPVSYTHLRAHETRR